MQFVQLLNIDVFLIIFINRMNKKSIRKRYFFCKQVL